MKVILLERVEKLGTLGDVVKVKDGFARNYLLPRAKALRANAQSLKAFEAQRAELEVRNTKAREAAADAGEKLDGTSYIMIRQAGESGQLYGSVSGRDVAEAVNAGGGKIDRASVVLDKPIKTLGVHPVKVRLHAEVTITVNINLARSQDEAERQARGENVIDSQFEEDRQAAEEAAQDMLEGG
ncbi:50S ribosomal protein L9, partial [Phenylobacterium sp.]|uniref:50S ribosomal protein L9 n=1 Tax=Phenylobacterium sp. TaxID=1871053 RepID=UPI002F405FC6